MHCRAGDTVKEAYKEKIGKILKPICKQDTICEVTNFKFLKGTTFEVSFQSA